MLKWRRESLGFNQLESVGFVLGSVLAVAGRSRMKGKGKKDGGEKSRK